MPVKYDSLKAGDEIYLHHEIDPCLYGQQIYVVYETEEGEKYIKCVAGNHFLKAMVNKNGEIQEFERVLQK